MTGEQGCVRSDPVLSAVVMNKSTNLSIVKKGVILKHIWNIIITARGEQPLADQKM